MKVATNETLKVLGTLQDKRQSKINIINFTLSFLQISIHLYFYFLVPILLLSSSSRSLLLILNAIVVALFCTNQLWAIIHEGIHGLLSSNKKVNNSLFSILSICFGSSSVFLKAIHHYHHRYNRSQLEQVESYDDKAKKSKITFIYYYNLFIGLYLSELFYPLMSLLPVNKLLKFRDRFFQSNLQISKMIDYFIERPRELKIMRLELVIVICVFSTTFYLFGTYWYIFLIFILLRGFLISFLDYVYHYETPLGNNLHGKNLKLPHYVSKFLLHFNLHGVHHQNPGVSWIELPIIFKQKKKNYDAHFIRASKEQMKGPIHEDQLPTKK